MHVEFPGPINPALSSQSVAVSREVSERARVRGNTRETPECSRPAPSRGEIDPVLGARREDHHVARRDRKGLAGAVRDAVPGEQEEGLEAPRVRVPRRDVARLGKPAGNAGQRFEGGRGGAKREMHKFPSFKKMTMAAASAAKHLFGPERSRLRT